MRFPIECHDETTGATRTVYIVKKWLGERDEEFMLDGLGRVYRRRGQGRLGVVLHSEPTSDGRPAADEPRASERGSRGSHVPISSAERLA